MSVIDPSAPSPQGGGIANTARGWLGTPYRHQASAKGVGCDCLGLVRGVWRELYGAEPEAMPAYRPDWAETGARETLLEAARRHLIEIALGDERPGDVLLFRMAADAVVKHAAILIASPSAADPQPRMIHAYWGRAVVESWIGPWWRRRLAFAFRFPAIEP
jgi:NlpC/P60 family putative phage cell wall peptidase